MSETLTEIQAFKQRIKSVNPTIDQNIITEDSQLTNNEDELGTPILAPNKTKGVSLQVINPIYRSITRSHESATKKKKRDLTDEEEVSLDVFSSYKKPKKNRK